MSKYHKTDGGLWPNNDKAKPTHPDMKGNVKISSEQMKGLDRAGTRKARRPRFRLPHGTARPKTLGRNTSMSRLKCSGMQRRKPPLPAPAKPQRAC